MKQLLQSLKDGSTELADVPVPQVDDGYLLVRTKVSLVSAGTERMLVEFGKGNLLQKARQQPERVRMVVEKARADGVLATYEAVQTKLEQPLALGYCNVGTVVESRSEGIEVDVRVVSNGQHAEFVSVPKNLCARIPDQVDDETASFTVLAAIAMQGVRLAKPTIGETVAVFGLGLIGLLTVQILRSQGCRVLGVDYDPSRLELAKEYGAEIVDLSAGQNVIDTAHSFSRKRGVDAVLLTASTPSSKPVSEAAQICRQRGRIVLVGVVGLDLNRTDFYEKEISFQVSCSYGPGRYDANYEEGGNDYPFGLVRWTEQRNFEAVLDLMASGLLNVEKMITHRFEIEAGADAMNLLASSEPSLGIILNYFDPSSPVPCEQHERRIQLGHEVSQSSGVVGFLGAGNYAGRVLIPAFKGAGAALQTLVSNGGVSAFYYGRKFGFFEASTESSAIFENDKIDTVVIATRHNRHADQVLASLRAGKHVFCEKPLCLNHDELNEIQEEANKRNGQTVMIGFNRRFAPQIEKIKTLLSSVNTPKSFIVTVNAGHIPQDHWTQDLKIGGGRIIGEACHFIDLLRYLVGFKIVSNHAIVLGDKTQISDSKDKISINLSFADGSIGTIHYFANGHRSFPKERVEVFVEGRVLQLDNFRKLKGWGWPGFKSMNLWRQEKGQKQCAAAFMSAIRNGGDAPISKSEIFEVSRVTIDVARSVGL